MEGKTRVRSETEQKMKSRICPFTKTEGIILDGGVDGRQKDEERQREVVTTLDGLESEWDVTDILCHVTEM